MPTRTSCFPFTRMGRTGSSALTASPQPALGLQQPLDLVDGQREGLRQLLRRGVTPGSLGELHVGATELADLVVDVHGQADLPPAIRDGPGDGLPDPPRGVRRELEAAPP